MTYKLPLALAAATAVAALPTLAATPAQPAGGFAGIWYEIVGGFGNTPYANKYGGGLATYPQQVGPMAVHVADANAGIDRTYFTYNARDPVDGSLLHAISYFDHNTGLVARPQVWHDRDDALTGGDTDDRDAHDAPVLAIDNQGFIYQFSMTHGEERRSYIRKSANPYDISAFNGLLSSNSPQDRAVFGDPPDNPNGSQFADVRFSYATAWYVPNAQENDKFLLQHTRYTNGNAERDLFTTTSADADTWTARKSFAAIEKGQYQTSWLKPDGQTVGTIFNVHPDVPSGLPLDARTDLFYLQTSDQARTWQTVDGTTLVDNSGANNDPLTSRPGGTALVYDAAPGERVYLKDVNYNAAGEPRILFLTTPTFEPGPTSVPRTVRVAAWDSVAGQWNLSVVTTTDHNYDHGSLFVEEDAGGNELWRVVAPFIDGPQAFGTGGEIGVWESDGSGFSLVDQLTDDSSFNQTYVRRPLYGQDDFYAFWAAGDAFEPSAVSLYFSDRSGNVYLLPEAFDPGAGFAAPVLVRAIPEPAAALLAAPAGLLLTRRRG